MNISELQIVVPAASAITVVGSLFAIWLKVKKEIGKDLDARAAALALALKNEMEKIDLKIAGLEKDITSLEAKLRGEVDHNKAVNDAEVESLKERIKSLQADVHQYHGRLLEILSDAVGKR